MSATLSGFPADTLDQFTLAAAARTPDKPAVVEEGDGGGLQETTYRELEQLVEDYAKTLGDLVDVGDRIVVEAHTSAHAAAMLLACSRVGAAFTPVTPDTPDAWLASIIEATDPVLHLRADGAPRRGPQAATARFGSAGIELETVPPRRPRRRSTVVGTDPAYIVFTSGSTGRPKGVVISHHAAMAFYRGALRFGVVGARDRVASTSPLSFDVALFDLGVTLGAGGTLLPVPREALSFPRRLCGFLRAAGATSVHAVPSIFRPLLRHEAEEFAGLERLRGIMFTGEEFPLPELRRLQSLRPDLRVVNAFGATETVAYSFAEVPVPLPETAARLSIGTGFPGGEMFLIDEQGEPVEAAGEVGEIYVRGPSKFDGYWGDPEATRRVLVPDPLNPRSGQLVYRSGDLAYRGTGGELYFCGRSDAMVKIRGNRIEPGEIERRLRAHPAVTAAAVVVVRTADPAEQALLAFATLAPPAAVERRELVEWCRSALPAYMVPRAVRILDELPQNSNGKVDRVALAKLVEGA